MRRRVYERALAFFTPDEIAEAFAAARGIASPSQLRSMLKRDGRDLVAEFRAMAPARRPISLQRWGPRRIVMALAAVGPRGPGGDERLRHAHAGRAADRRRAGVRHRRRHDPHGPGGPDGHRRPVRGRPPRRLERRPGDGAAGRSPLLARLRPRRRARRGRPAPWTRRVRGRRADRGAERRGVVAALRRSGRPRRRRPLDADLRRRPVPVCATSSISTAWSTTP